MGTLPKVGGGGAAPPPAAGEPKANGAAAAEGLLLAVAFDVPNVNAVDLGLAADAAEEAVPNWNTPPGAAADPND